MTDPVPSLSPDSHLYNKLLNKDRFAAPKGMGNQAEAYRQEKEWKRKNGGLLTDHGTDDTLLSFVLETEANNTNSDFLLDNSLSTLLSLRRGGTGPYEKDGSLNKRFAVVLKHSDKTEKELVALTRAAFDADKEASRLEGKISDAKSEMRRLGVRDIDLGLIMADADNSRTQLEALNEEATKHEKGLATYQYMALKNDLAGKAPDAEQEKQLAALRDCVGMDQKQMDRFVKSIGGLHRKALNENIQAMQRKVDAYARERAQLEKETQRLVKIEKMQQQAQRENDRQLKNVKPQIQALKNEIVGYRKQQASLISGLPTVGSLLKEGADEAFREDLVRNLAEDKTSRVAAENRLGNVAFVAGIREHTNIPQNEMAFDNIDIAVDDPRFRLALSADGQTLKSPDTATFQRSEADIVATLRKIRQDESANPITFHDPVSEADVHLGHGERKTLHFTMAEGAEVDLTAVERPMVIYANGGGRYLLSKGVGKGAFNLNIENDRTQPVVISIPSDTDLKTSHISISDGKAVDSVIGLIGSAKRLILGQTHTVDGTIEMKLQGDVRIPLKDGVSTNVNLEVRGGALRRMIPLVRQGVSQFKSPEELVRRVEEEKQTLTGIRNKLTHQQIHDWLDENLKLPPVDQVADGYIRRFAEALLPSISAVERERFEERLKTVALGDSRGLAVATQDIVTAITHSVPESSRLLLRVFNDTIPGRGISRKAEHRLPPIDAALEAAANMSTASIGQRIGPPGAPPPPNQGVAPRR